MKINDGHWLNGRCRSETTANDFGFDDIILFLFFLFGRVKRLFSLTNTNTICFCYRSDFVSMLKLENNRIEALLMDSLLDEIFFLRFVCVSYSDMSVYAQTVDVFANLQWNKIHKFMSEQAA